MHAELAPVLGGDHSPVVVPARQQVIREGGDSGGADVTFGALNVAVDQTVGQGLGVVNVDNEALMQTEVLGGHLHGLAGGPFEPEDGRAQAGAGVLAGGLRPERAGYLVARHRTVAHSQKGQEPLRAGRDAQKGATPYREEETPEEPEFVSAVRFANGIDGTGSRKSWTMYSRLAGGSPVRLGPVDRAVCDTKEWPGLLVAPFQRNTKIGPVRPGH